MNKQQRVPKYAINQLVCVNGIEGLIIDVSFQDGEPDYLLVPSHPETTFCSEYVNGAVTTVHEEHAHCKACECKYRSGWFLEHEVSRE